MNLEPVGFIIQFDEEKADTLNMVLNMAADLAREKKISFEEPELRSLIQLTTEVSDKIHMMKWCKDPNCTYEITNKNNEQEK